MWTLYAVALAGDLDVARATRALREGRPHEALQHARAALDDRSDADAWVAWLDACTAAGIREACRAEAALAGSTDETALVAALWHDVKLEQLDREEAARSVPAVTELAAGTLAGQPVHAGRMAALDALVKADPDAGAAAALDAVSSMPEHPEVVVPIFAEGLPAGPALGRSRKKLARTGAKAIRNATPPVLYGWHEVFVALGDTTLAGQTADALEAAGEPRPLARQTQTRAESVQAARALMESPGELPTLVPSEREGVALRLAEMLANAGRHAESVERLAAARELHDSASLAVAHAEALAAAGQLDRALEVADDAVALAVAPWPTDVAISDRVGRRIGLARTLSVRGRIRLENGDAAGGAVDLRIAGQLDEAATDVGALEKAMRTGHFALEEVKARLETASDGAHVVAMRAATEATDPAEIAAHASDAIAVLCLPTHAKARLTARMSFLPELASALAVRARARQAQGDAAGARADVLLALMLVPWDAPADWWALAAELHEAAGSHEAAFFAHAMVAAASDEVGPAPWFGDAGAGAAASAAMVASWMRGHAELEPPKDRIRVQRGRVVTFQRPRAPGPPVRPVINEPFPAWTIADDAGTVSHQQGRIEILTFFRTDSPNSLRLLDEVTEMARALRKAKGVNVVLIGVCMDPEPAALEGMRARREMWGTTKWDPDLGERFGVTAFPTTWIVDSEGVARFEHVGYLGWSDYEAEVRFIFGM